MRNNDCSGGLYHESLGENARLAFDTLLMKPVKGIPQWMLHLMQVSELEYFSGHNPGDYSCNPAQVYLDFQRSVGTCFIDQFIPDNPLSMGDEGYDKDTTRTPVTCADEIILDGMRIDSPEAVVEHLERYVFPRMRQIIAGHGQTAKYIGENEINREKCVETAFGPDLGFDPDDTNAPAAVINRERNTQALFGPDILKVPWTFSFPFLRYEQYGYVNYFMAYALYPEVMERDFKMQAEVSIKLNDCIAAAIIDGGLPPVVRLDHDMADGRSTLIDIQSLDRIWFPHFERAIQPFLKRGIRLIWHCDGNLMGMVPRLLETGIGGFQGFQYEHGMEYERICRMSDRNNNPLMIWAGVSVTKTLPYGKPEDVVRELRWLVEKGPPVGLCLGCSSSIVPGTNRANLRTLFEGLAFHRKNGRAW